MSLDMIFTFLEYIGILFSLGYVLCNIKEHKATWAFGLISSAVYVFVFTWGKLYASALLSVISCFPMVYGWYMWQNAEQKDKISLEVTTFSLYGRISVTLGSIALSVAVYVFLSYFEGATLLWGDAVIAGTSLVGLYCAAKKKIETWYIWILVNILAVSVYTAAELYPTAILYAVFLGLAFSGLFAWKKKIANDNSESTSRLHASLDG